MPAAFRQNAENGKKTISRKTQAKQQDPRTFKVANKIRIFLQSGLICANVKIRLKEIKHIALSSYWDPCIVNATLRPPLSHNAPDFMQMV